MVVTMESRRRGERVERGGGERGRIGGESGQADKRGRGDELWKTEYSFKGW
jgi:hypothetical protein